MNPLRIAQRLREDYLTLLRTTFSPRQDALREAFNREIERDGFLTREPFVSLAQPYMHANTPDFLLPEIVERFGQAALTPYVHQVTAARRIADGLPTVVSTGTGSGKTEAFLLPIVDHCLRHREEPGVKAILIYPMNALATDQLRRVRDRMAGSGVTFGRYTGETQIYGTRPADAPVEERVTRVEFRAEPPHLLLTNYQMLEYMLLRGDGRDIFRGHRVRFIVLDEVHTYHGALGTDVACLLRRLRATLLESGGETPPLFIGTSATLQAGVGETDPREGVARFFTQLTGQETIAEAVIMETFNPPPVPTTLTLPPVPAISEEDLSGFDPTNEAAVLSFAQVLAGVPPDDNRPLPELWAEMKLPYLLFNWLARSRSINDVVERLGQEPERAGVPQEALQREIEAMLLIGPCLPDSSDLRLRPRVHRFLRGLARFYRCMNSDCGQLLNEGVTSCPTCGSGALPLAVCRTCGWDFLVARSVENRVESWPERTPSTQNTLYLYDPPTMPVAVDTEDSPFEGEEDAENGTVASAPEEDEPVAADLEYVCPRCMSRYDDPSARDCDCGDEYPLHAVRVYQGRGSRCPVCHSRYGRYEVLTPVSMGNSSALSHVSRTLLRELPDENKKILVFCDSRQDAAHQARFIEGIEGHRRLRRTVYRLLFEDGHPHDLRWLVEHVYHNYVEHGFLPRARARDAIQREMFKIEGDLLSEFVLAANVRAALERLGLIAIQYADLDEEFDADTFRQLCERNALNPERARLAIVRLLNLMRGRFAVDHEIFRVRMYRNDRLSNRYGISPGRQVGFPQAFQPAGTAGSMTNTYKLNSTWNETGSPTAVQQLWRRILGSDATLESLTAVMQWLETGGWITWSQIGRNGDEVSGFQVSAGVLEFEIAHEFLRCGVCGRAATDGAPGDPCARTGCEGGLVRWEGALAQENLNAIMVASDYAPALMPAEHSAAVSDEDRHNFEEGFQANPPRYNVLVCTPTLELGVNIGDLEAIAMRNIPPSPANYAQRSGRTGRTSRMGTTVGFAKNTPHDGYFFDHPDEMIAGAIPPPRFNDSNRQAIARHIRSLVLQEAQIDFPSSLENYISEDGGLNATSCLELRRQIERALTTAAQKARVVFGHLLAAGEEGWENWLEDIVQRTPSLVYKAIEQRASLVESAVSLMRALGTRVRLTYREQEQERGYREMARKLREDRRYAYLLRVLAELGVLPGYSFPGDPGSLALGYEPEPIFTGRLQAQREYAPGQTVYARGHRWRVTGIAMNRPGASGRSRGEDRFDYTLCPSCDLAVPTRGANNCARCGAELNGATYNAWDAGAFQAMLAEVEPETEEDRSSKTFDVRFHPQRDVPGLDYSLGPWRFQLRRQEEVWWINHGLLPAAFEGDSQRPLNGFHLCLRCGELRPEPQPQEEQNTRRSRRAGARDPRADQDPHDARCGGTPAHIALGHQGRADTLRLFVPGLASLGQEGVAWSWSFAWAIVRGAVRLFDIDEDDLEPRVLTRWTDGRTEVMEIIWVDAMTGGSGILQDMIQHFPAVAQSALEHLQGHDCPTSCYRCLKSYRNQRVHRILNWRITVPHLTAAIAEMVTSLGSTPPPQPITEGPEWDEARHEGCDSPLELVLLRAMRDGSLAEPEKQYTVEDENGRILTRADFAFPAQRILVYVDGLAFHSSARARVHDAMQSNRLQNMGYRVLRFPGPQVAYRVRECVEVIRSALT